VGELSALGFEVTQATVSRDIAELGLAKVMRGDRSVYVLPETMGDRRPASDDRLRRILSDIPVTVGRSGLILVLNGQPGTANVIAQAIEESTLDGFVGTVAGDNTLIVLFPDEPSLLAWLERFDALNSAAEAAPLTEAPVR
jgi:transcriptional regulator of arginine metabolism